jgi:hypothetical protein
MYVGELLPVAVLYEEIHFAFLDRPGRRESRCLGRMYAGRGSRKWGTQNYTTTEEPVRKVFIMILSSGKCSGEVLNLLENWRGASFANVIQQTGFGEPGKGAPHGHEDTCFASHA